MELESWLRSLGLEQYEAAFRENAITDKVLPNLTAEDLKDLGVVIVGHRRTLLDAIALLRAETAPKPQPPEAAVAPPKPAKDTAERRQVTVMFSDLVGSTALSARMDPEDLREVISGYQKSVAETVQRFGGFVAKYMGDGVLVYFGYPQAHEDDAERAVRAGLELVGAVSALKLNAALQTRIGIATGLVVVGDLIGSGEAQERGIVGETPNLAARLQGIAEPNTVVIAENTRKLLGSLFELQDLGAKEVKGITEPVRAWAAQRASSVASRFEALHATGLTALVGRAEELELLLRRWSRAKTGEGQVVLLSGEAGIGKSRLTAELLERLAAEPHTRLRYFCSPQRTDSALYPVIGQMERAAGSYGDTAQVKLDKLDTLLARTSTSKQDAALFAEMLSLPNDGRYPALNMDQQQRRQKTLEALTAQVEALSRQNPVLMIFEDAHWTDPTSLETFGRVIDRVRSLPVLLIVTFRPEFEPPWIGRPYVTALTINRLAEREIGAMIDRLIGNKLLPANVRQDIIERTDGIPLFVEETTKAVLEAEGEGAAERTVAAVPSPALAVPASLHASLMARLDRLGPAKEIAQIGAAIGREFSHELLASVVRKSEAELGLGLDRLIQAGLLFRQGVAPHATYLFKHALVQEAAYSTLLRSRRQQLHRRITDILEGLFSQVAETQPELMVRHCVEANLVEKAVDYSLKAGRQALRRSAMMEALGQLRKGLTILGSMPESIQRQRRELKFQTALGGALIATQGFSTQITGEAYARAVHLCRLLDQPAQLAPALSGQWVHHLVRAELGRARQLSQEMLELGEERDDAELRFMGLRYSGQTCLYLAEFGEGRVRSERALAHYVPSHRRSLENAHAGTLCDISRELLCLGYLDQARVRQAQALEEARKLSHAYTLAYALAIGCQGDWGVVSDDLMLRRAKELVAVTTEHHLIDFLQIGTIWLELYNVATGQQTSGMERIQTALAHNRHVGSKLFEPLNRVLLANACGKHEQPQAGLDQLAEAERIMEMTNQRWTEAELHRVRSKLLAAVGEPVRAEDSLHRAMAIAQRQSAKLWELRAALDLARLWRDQGKRKEARELLAPVYGWFTEGFDTRDLKEAKALLDELNA